MLTATDSTAALDISMAFDLEKEPACEHSGHPKGIWGHADEPAWAIIRFHPSCQCTGPTTLLICKSGYDHALRVGVRCYHCNGPTRSALEAWELVSIL